MTVETFIPYTSQRDAVIATAKHSWNGIPAECYVKYFDRLVRNGVPQGEAAGRTLYTREVERWVNSTVRA